MLRGCTLPILILVFTACSSSEAQAPTGGGASGGVGGSSGATGSGGSAAAGGTAANGGTPGGGTGGSGEADAGMRCAPGSPGPTPTSVCLLEVSGRVVDEAGAPVAGLVTSVCGPVCYNGESDANGAFKVTLGEHLELGDYSVIPHGRPSRAGFYFQLPDTAQTTIAVGELLLPAMPADGPVLVVKTDRAGAPAQSVTSGDVTLEVPAGILVELDVEDVLAAELGKKFRVLSVPADQRARFAHPDLGIRALYAFAPFESSFIRESDESLAGARLSFVNSAGFAAGAAIDVLALGTYLFPEWVKPAAFVTVATARVTSDGSRIEMEPGESLPHLTWVGLRAKP